MRYFHLNKKKLKCYRCQAPMKVIPAIQGGPSTFWMRCSTPNCHTYYNTAVPMPHQDIILRDPARELGIFGGYGSGKTFTGYQGDQKHILLTENGETLVGADTLVQLENTVRKDLERDFPSAFVKHYNRQKNMITFINGHVLYYRPLAEADELRSYNLTRAHMLEASGVKHESYVQLQTRLRNERAVVYHTDENDAPVMEDDPETGGFRKKEKLNWSQLVAESNPDVGWIRENFLLRSGRINIHFDKQKYHVNPDRTNPEMSSHIVPSKANFHLPNNFVENLKRDKPRWWINRYLYGSFDYSEGMVYPHISEAIIKGFKIPDHWPRIIGMDYGLNDNTHFMFGAVDFHGEHTFNNGRPAVYWFHEIVLNDASLSEIASAYKVDVRQHVPRNTLYRTPPMDGRSYHQRTRTGEKKTIGSLLREEGCIFKAAQMDLEARIVRTNDFIDNGMMYFFEDGVPHAIEEFKKYRYQDKKLESTSKANKPIDKDNHGINATEFATMELPYKLREPDTHVYSSEGPLTRKRGKRGWDPLKDHRDGHEGFGKVFDF